MSTLVAQPNNNDVDAAFKDHLLAVLSLHDAPRAAAAPIPRYISLSRASPLRLPLRTAFVWAATPQVAPTSRTRPTPYPYPYIESPGVFPTGGALASAATQGGMDALEELRLLKDQVGGRLQFYECLEYGCLGGGGGAEWRAAACACSLSRGHLYRRRRALLPCLSLSLSLPALFPPSLSLPLVPPCSSYFSLFPFGSLTLAHPVRDVPRVCNAVASGDLTQKITVLVQGDLMVQLKKVINTMVDNLGHFATEVTRVSRDVGTEGKLGAQAHVEDVEGTWRELTR
ncbi:hypothetical protein B0H16DRAFT_1891897 [Mycena metata]|uniref:HAMP domain-containing protein n=1 Tax=Mycena metata TaxID=1033252 RepID=A0AAD7I7A0_9AGAR|nr:hypothetical protein B0H16DRAFT_1891897 [Mycena metata]